MIDPLSTLSDDDSNLLWHCQLAKVNRIIKPEIRGGSKNGTLSSFALASCLVRLSLSLRRVRSCPHPPPRRKERGRAGRSLGSCVTKTRLTSDIRRCYPIGCGRTTEPNKYYATAATACCIDVFHVFTASAMLETFSDRCSVSHLHLSVGFIYFQLTNSTFHSANFFLLLNAGLDLEM